jgi:hypothetical protein
MEKKHYIYLVKNSNHTKFKLGRTFTSNPRNRLKNYITHNPDVKIEGFWEVPNEKFEKFVFVEVIKLGFLKDNTKHQKEWFWGNIFKFEVENIINKLKEQHEKK